MSLDGVAPAGGWRGASFLHAVRGVHRTHALGGRTRPPQALESCVLRSPQDARALLGDILPVCLEFLR